MSDFHDVISTGFAEAMEILNPADSQGRRQVEITHKGQRRPCIATSFMQSRALREQGYDMQIPSIVELTKPDFQTLAIADRDEVEVSSVKFTVLVIDTDDHDPCVRLHLKTIN